MRNNRKWYNRTYCLDSSSIFSKDLLIKYVTLFWDNIFLKLDNQHVLLLLRFHFENEDIRTIGQLQRLNPEDKAYYINYIVDKIGLISDSYKTTPIVSITFSYGIRKGAAEEKIVRNPDIKFQSYYNNKLPVTFNPLDYGKLLEKNGDKFYIVKINENAFVNITQINDENGKYNLVKYYKHNNLMYEWKDIYISESSFKRELGKSTYIYDNDELKLLKIIKPAKYIQSLKSNRNKNTRIITMDLETINNNGELTPYLLAWFDGEIHKSYFINDFKSFDKLMLQEMNDLSIKKYRNYKIYLHNLSSFDGIFLLKHLSNINGANITPIINDNKIISIKLSYRKVILHFRDSLLLLPASLKELSKSFNNKVEKDIFPIYLDINYNGGVPNIKYFKNISLEEYNKYSQLFITKTWNFRNESIKYCLIDCIALFEILTKFNDLIFDKFNLNINDYPTLPSLSFANFRTNYLIEKTLVGLSGDVYSNIRNSYTGGSVDMFIPSNDSNDKVYCYDVNSLYPFVMQDNDMPIGIPTFFEGDIWKENSEAFGFFFVEVIVPENILHPIIQLHHKTDDGIRTISPRGRFEVMLFSPEILNAMKYGYKFNIKWGYTFDRGNIFKDLISDLYSIRTSYPKTDPMNLIAKLLMNSLYGRFGMSDIFNDTKIIDKKGYAKFEDNNNKNIKDIMEIGNKYLVTLKKEYLDSLLDNGSISHNINIAIASAVSSYARIHMSIFKNNPEYLLYYTDTDSIFINKPLNPKLVSNNELGKMKLEYTATSGVFLAPKVYAVRIDDGKLIIKIKGLPSNTINLIIFEDLEKLLDKNSKLLFETDKWFKSIKDGTINILKQIYTLINKINSDSKSDR